MVQSHSIFEKVGDYLAEERSEKEVVKNPVEAFLKGVNDIRKLWNIGRQISTVR